MEYFKLHWQKPNKKNQPLLCLRSTKSNHLRRHREEGIGGYVRSQCQDLGMEKAVLVVVATAEDGWGLHLAEGQEVPHRWVQVSGVPHEFTWGYLGALLCQCQLGCRGQ